ncbi:hypothetical protein Tco_1099309, partial [Tanacetum coccineum]
ELSKESQATVEKNPHDQNLRKKSIEIMEEYCVAVKDEEKLVAQKARIDWLNEGDKNSAFFHKIIKGRRSRNRFLGYATNVSDISDSSGLFNNILTQDEANIMIREVADDEIKNTLKDVCEAIKELFLSSQMLGELNATLITLIPKIQTLMKNNQSAFIPGRVIQDNIMLSQEILRGYGRKNGPKRCAMKIDLQKAYDTRKIRDRTEFKYHQGCNDLQLINLCFADDLMIFCHGDAISVSIVKEAIEEFSDISGLHPITTQNFHQ